LLLNSCYQSADTANTSHSWATTQYSQTVLSCLAALIITTYTRVSYLINSPTVSSRQTLTFLELWIQGILTVRITECSLPI